MQHEHFSTDWVYYLAPLCQAIKRRVKCDMPSEACLSFFPCMSLCQVSEAGFDLLKIPTEVIQSIKYSRKGI